MVPSFDEKEKDLQPEAASGPAETEIDAKAVEAAVVEKFDKASAFRNKLPSQLNFVIGALLVAFSLYQLYASIWTVQARMLRPTHLAFALVLAYLLYPAHRKGRRDRIAWYDYLLAGLAGFVTLYIPANLDFLVRNVGRFEMWPTIIIGAIGILLVMEACRRVVGLPILVVVIAFLTYTFLGSHIPGTFGHRGFNLTQIVTHQYFTLEGVFGTPLGVSATFIFLFVLFGAFLEKTGVGAMFIDLATALAGRFSGGPAKVAVIASALQGAVSGSSVANAASTGPFTIPAMKKLGYKPEFAAGVEAAASTGGQIVPPVMGAAAFLMAEITGYPFAYIVLASLVPALLYFAGVLISTHHEARKLGLRGLDPANIPKVSPLIKERGYLIMPLIIIIYMLSTRTTPTHAAMAAMLTAVMVYSQKWLGLIPVAVMIIVKDGHSWFEGLAAVSVDVITPSFAFPWQAAGLLSFNTQTLHIFNMNFRWYSLVAIAIWLIISLIRRKFGITIFELIEMLRLGARNSLSVVIACATAGMIVGAVTQTGVGLAFGNALASLAGGNIYLLMFFTMLASLILGLGVPTTAKYLIIATVCAPAMIRVLVDMQGLALPTTAIVLSVHMFVFYFGIAADITPPVALVPMATSAIAGSDPFRTSVTASRIAIAAFIVPFIFVLHPSMLLIDANFWVVIPIATALVGMYTLSAGLTGFLQDRCNILERFLLIVGGLVMIYPETISSIAGIAALVFVYMLQIRRVRARKLAA